MRFFAVIFIVIAMTGCQNSQPQKPAGGGSGVASSEMVLRGEIMIEYEGDYGPNIKQLAGVVWDKEIRNKKDFRVWINSQDFERVRKQIYEFESFIQKTGGSMTTYEYKAADKESPSIRVSFSAPAPKE